MRLRLSDVARTVGAAAPTSDREVTSVSVDSRTLAQDALFVPIVAERDGHDFVDAAFRAGATAVLTSKPSGRDGEVIVHDTAVALRSLAVWARSAMLGPLTGERVVAITGSAGKTSTKDMLAAVLSRRGPVAASEKSFNNELGVPLTILNAPSDAWAAVIEMGARGPGHIASLCAVALPSVGIVTNIGVAHLGEFGSVEAIADAKGELIAALPASGTAVLPGDDAFFGALCGRARCAVLSFGTSTTADVRASNVVLDADLRPSFRLESPWGSEGVRLSASGAHQVPNALAAIGAGLTVGATLADTVEALSAAVLSPARMEVIRTRCGAVVINDAYNANPASMRAGLDALAGVAASRRVAVLGTMAELGETGPARHVDIAEFAAASGIDVIAVAEPAYGALARHVADQDEATETLRSMGPLDDRVAVLVKGSLVAGLQPLARRLVELAGGAR